MGIIETNRVTSVGTSGESEVTLSTTSTKILDAKTSRNYLLIQNNDASISVYLKFAAAHGVGEKFIVIPPGGNYEPLTVPTDAIYMKSASGVPVVTVIYGTNLGNVWY